VVFKAFSGRLPRADLNSIRSRRPLAVNHRFDALRIKEPEGKLDTCKPFPMDVSVIICTWNNCERLAITLDVISHCIVPSDPTWELVFVNNNSVDETKNITTDYSSKLPLVYTEEPQQGLSRARNRGIKVATGNLIVFTDDDTKPCPEWIEVYWNAYMDKPSGFFLVERSGPSLRLKIPIQNSFVPHLSQSQV
jgi:GT2 family glycosyltransferase